MAGLLDPEDQYEIFLQRKVTDADFYSKSSDFLRQPKRSFLCSFLKQLHIPYTGTVNDIFERALGFMLVQEEKEREIQSSKSKASYAIKIEPTTISSPKKSSSDAKPELNWVQCDTCEKWRVLRGGDPTDLPEKWTCSMNVWDLDHSKCEDPQEAEEVEEGEEDEEGGEEDGEGEGEAEPTEIDPVWAAELMAKFRAFDAQYRREFEEKKEKAAESQKERLKKKIEKQDAEMLEALSELSEEEVEKLKKRSHKCIGNELFGTLPIHLYPYKYNDKKCIDSMVRDLHFGIDVNEPDGAGRTPLFYAAEYERWDYAQALIDRGADLDYPDDLGTTPAMMMGGRKPRKKSAHDKYLDSFLGDEDPQELRKKRKQLTFSYFDGQKLDI